MSSLVIVAIPAEDDIVWKISSEKVPHLTLMYLGEFEPDDNVQRMADFVEHALNVSEHGPFYLEVDHRGELGPDKADVLFFEHGWDSKWIKSLRGQLLQQNDIRAEYEEAEAAGAQFPDWVPHLTLGYPTTPAKPVPDDRKIYSVQFDRIAVWTGNYEGPEFRLKWPERDLFDSPAVAYGEVGEAAVADILSHHGIKGMKWGRRKDDSGGGSGNAKSVIEKPKNNLTKKQTAAVSALAGGGAVAGAAAAAPSGLPTVGAFAGAFAGLGIARTNKSVARGLDANEKQQAAYRQDKKWEKEFKKDKKYADVHNGMADHMNSWLPGHNKKYDGIDLNKSPTKMKEYEDAYFKEQGASFAKSYSKVYGKSPSGKYAVSVIPGTNKVVLHNINVDPSAFHHAADDEPLMTFAVTHDETGRIIKVDPVVDSIAQSAEGEEFILEHYGAKGMKWGIRKDRQGRDRFKVEGHTTKSDVAKAFLLPSPTNVPALYRLGSRAHTKVTTGTKAYMEKRNHPDEVAKREKRKLGRRDFYWEMHSHSDISHADVHNKVADEIDGKVHQLQNAPKYRGKNLKTDKGLETEYHQDVAKVTDAAYRRAVKDTYGVNPSGTKSAHYVNDVRGQRVEVRDSKSGKSLYETALTKHATQDAHDESILGHAAIATQAYSGPDLIITMKPNNNGFIDQIGRIKLPEDSMAQSMDEGEAFVEDLVHFGIKGMRWGTRKSEPVAAATSASSRVPHGTKRKTKIQVRGGENHPATEDALKAAQARVKLHKSGPSSLSNKELKELADRLRLEQQVKELSRGDAHKFVREFVTGQGKQTLNVATGSRIQNKVRAK